MSEADLSDGLRRLGLELTTRQERALFKAMGERRDEEGRQGTEAERLDILGSSRTAHTRETY